MTRHYEADILVPTLRLLAANGWMDTEARLAELSKVIALSPEDNALLKGRNDSYFSQHVRNQVSHRNDEGNIVYEGYAVYDENLGLNITARGKALISR